MKVIDNSKFSKCWSCNGTGYKGKEKCKNCHGTGKFRESHYILISHGMAFGMDTIK